MLGWLEFQAMPVPAAPSENEPECFAAAAGDGQSWLARDSHGAPCLVIATPAAERSELRFEHLRVQVSLPCEVQTPSGATRATLTVLRCTSPREELQRLFISLHDAILASVGNPASADTLSRVIQQLAAMFASLSRPARNTVQGLWGELFLIARSPDPLRMIRAWHATPGDDYDFAEGVERVEAKTTSSHKREHSFTLDQLQPPENAVVRVASMIARPSGGGSSVSALAAEIEPQLESDPMARMKLHALIVETLGADWLRAADCRFDRELAASSLRFYLVAAIPQLRGPVPAGVSHVSFVSDLTNVPLAELARGGSLFEAATPVRGA